MNWLEHFDTYRPLLFSIAYRMLGTVMDAEDILQEAFIRCQQTGDLMVESPKAYLSTIVTRLCIDQLRSAQSKRESYIGPWLPEPLLTTTPDDLTVMAESLSIAFLVLLERLSPLERAAFLLRNVFDYDYPTIATMLDKTETACRQIIHRANERIANQRPRFDADLQQRDTLLQQFIAACASGDLAGLMSLLTDDITLTSDGGGKVAAAQRPVMGASHVARLLLGLTKRMPEGASVEPHSINNAAGLVVFLDNQPLVVFAFQTDGQQIQNIYAIVNPDKLAHLRRP